MSNYSNGAAFERECKAAIFAQLSKLERISHHGN